MYAYIFEYVTLERVVTIFLLTIIIGIPVLFAVLILYGIFIAIDSWFLPLHEGDAEVISKEHIPATTSLILVPGATPSMTFPYFINHDDDWVVEVEMGGQYGEISLEREDYRHYRVGQRVVIDYSRGRLTGNLYVKAIS